jgi:hypothetical protein
MNISGRQLAKILGLSARQIGRMEDERLIVREHDGTFCLERTVPLLFRQLRDRLTLAEALCRRWCPHELEARWADRGRRALPRGSH